MPLQRLVRAARVAPLVALSVLLAGCAAPFRTALPPPQSPSSYLTGALEWLQSHEVRGNLDWAQIRRQAMASARHARSIAGTYPAINAVFREMGDPYAWLIPNDPTSLDSGYAARYPDGLVMILEPGGAAARAGVRLGDRVVQVDGKPPALAPQTGLNQISWMKDGPGARQRLTVRRAGRTLAITFTSDASNLWGGSAPVGWPLAVGGNTIGYLRLSYTSGTASYATSAQQLLQRIDEHGACGWVVDLRQTTGGDLWSYLAAVGPILGQADLGGFQYGDGTRDSWAYRGGAVIWAGQTRYEGKVDGAVYMLKRPAPPVALLINRLTSAAGENVIVAFAGRSRTRTFGAPTFGAPVFQDSTELSDGAYLSLSGAYSFDRTGLLYDGPIAPNVAVSTDWSQFGTNRDPAVHSAITWLLRQSGCAR